MRLEITVLPAGVYVLSLRIGEEGKNRLFSFWGCRRCVAMDATGYPLAPYSG